MAPRQLDHRSSRCDIGRLLPQLRAAFVRLERIDGKHSAEEWIDLLAQRETADPLTDDAWYRGYLVGVADALGISVADLVEVIQSKPRRRIVQVRRAG